MVTRWLAGLGAFLWAALHWHWNVAGGPCAAAATVPPDDAAAENGGVKLRSSARTGQSPSACFACF